MATLLPAPQARLEPLASAESPEMLRERLAAAGEPGPTKSSPGTPLSIVGRVLTAASNEPVAECVVTLYRGSKAAGDGGDVPPLAEALTDAAGSFQVALDRAGWTLGAVYRASVRSPAGDRVFDGPVPLQQHLVIHVGERRLIRGVCQVDGRSWPEAQWLQEAAPRARLRISLADGYSTTDPPFLGLADVDAEGRFEVRVVADSMPLELSMVLVAGRLAFAEIVPAAPFFRAEGGVVDLGIRGLQVAVTDESGACIPDARVIAMSRARSARGGLVPAQSMTTDGEGHGLLRTHRDDLHVCAGKQGYQSHVGVIPREAFDEGEPYQITLKPLQAHHRVRGVVAGRDRAPVAGAVVLAVPTGVPTYVASAGDIETTTGHDGRFEIVGCATTPLAVWAKIGRERTHVVTLMPDGQQELLLTRVAKGGIRLQLRAQEFGLPAVSGRVEVVWRNITSASEGSGAFAMPVSIPYLDPGRYQVHATLPGRRLYAQAVAEVRENEVTSAELDLAPASWLEGRLVDPQGRAIEGARLCYRDAPWSVHGDTGWGRAETDAEGRFSVFAGGTERAALVVEDAGGARLGELIVSCGRPKDHVLPAAR